METSLSGEYLRAWQVWSALKLENKIRFDGNVFRQSQNAIVYVSQTPVFPPYPPTTSPSPPDPPRFSAYELQQLMRPTTQAEWTALCAKTSGGLGVRGEVGERKGKAKAIREVETKDNRLVALIAGQSLFDLESLPFQLTNGENLTKQTLFEVVPDALTRCYARVHSAGFSLGCLLPSDFVLELLQEDRDKEGEYKVEAFVTNFCRLTPISLLSSALIPYLYLPISPTNLDAFCGLYSFSLLKCLQIGGKDWTTQSERTICVHAPSYDPVSADINSLCGLIFAWLYDVPLNYPIHLGGEEGKREEDEEDEEEDGVLRLSCARYLEEWKLILREIQKKHLARDLKTKTKTKTKTKMDFRNGIVVPKFLKSREKKYRVTRSFFAKWKKFLKLAVMEDDLILENWNQWIKEQKFEFDLPRPISNLPDLFRPVNLLDYFFSAALYAPHKRSPNTSLPPRPPKVSRAASEVLRLLTQNDEIWGALMLLQNKTFGNPEQTTEILKESERPEIAEILFGTKLARHFARFSPETTRNARVSHFQVLVGLLCVSLVGKWIYGQADLWTRPRTLIATIVFGWHFWTPSRIEIEIERSQQPDVSATTIKGNLARKRYGKAESYLISKYFASASTPPAPPRSSTLGGGGVGEEKKGEGKFESQIQNFGIFLEEFTNLTSEQNYQLWENFPRPTEESLRGLVQFQIESQKKIQQQGDLEREDLEGDENKEIFQIHQFPAEENRITKIDQVSQHINVSYTLTGVSMFNVFPSPWKEYNFHFQLFNKLNLITTSDTPFPSIVVPLQAPAQVPSTSGGRGVKGGGREEKEEEKGEIKIENQKVSTITFNYKIPERWNAFPTAQQVEGKKATVKDWKDWKIVSAPTGWSKLKELDAETGVDFILHLAFGLRWMHCNNFSYNALLQPAGFVSFQGKDLNSSVMFLSNYGSLMPCVFVGKHGTPPPLNTEAKASIRPQNYQIFTQEAIWVWRNLGWIPFLDAIALAEIVIRELFPELIQPLQNLPKPKGKNKDKNLSSRFRWLWKLFSDDQQWVQFYPDENKTQIKKAQTLPLSRSRTLGRTLFLLCTHGLHPDQIYSQMTRYDPFAFFLDLSSTNNHTLSIHPPAPPRSFPTSGGREVKRVVRKEVEETQSLSPSSYYFKTLSEQKGFQRWIFKSWSDQEGFVWLTISQILSIVMLSDKIRQWLATTQKAVLKTTSTTSTTSLPISLILAENIGHLIWSTNVSQVKEAWTNFGKSLSFSSSDRRKQEIENKRLNAVQVVWHLFTDLGQNNDLDLRPGYWNPFVNQQAEARFRNYVLENRQQLVPLVKDLVLSSTYMLAYLRDPNLETTSRFQLCLSTFPPLWVPLSPSSKPPYPPRPPRSTKTSGGGGVKGKGKEDVVKDESPRCLENRWLTIARFEKVLEQTWEPLSENLIKQAEKFFSKLSNKSVGEWEVKWEENKLSSPNDWKGRLNGLVDETGLNLGFPRWHSLKIIKSYPHRLTPPPQGQLSAIFEAGEIDNFQNVYSEWEIASEWKAIRGLTPQKDLGGAGGSESKEKAKNGKQRRKKIKDDEDEEKENDDKFQLLIYNLSPNKENRTFVDIILKIKSKQIFQRILLPPSHLTQTPRGVLWWRVYSFQNPTVLHLCVC